MVVRARQRPDLNSALSTHFNPEDQCRTSDGVARSARLPFSAGLGNTNANAQQIKTVFVIAMENHNWTQPANQFTGSIQQIFQNPAAPFINSLVAGSAFAMINGSVVHISEQVAYATNYHSVLATPERKQPSYPSVRAELHLGRSGHQFRRAQRQRSFPCQRPDQPGHGPAFDRFAPRQLEGRGGRIRKTSTSRETPPGSSPTSRSHRDQWTVPLTSFSGTFATGFFNDFNLAHAVQLRRQAQSDGVLHRYQRRQ